MDSNFVVTITGRLARDPEAASYDWGVRTDLVILVTLPKVDRNGERYTAERYIRVRTYDLDLSARVVRQFKMGDWVEVICDDIRPGEVYFDRSHFDRQTGERGKWKASRERFILAGIKKATAKRSTKTADGKATDATKAAEAEVLNGVTG